jgi:hypothetical protein
MATLSASTIRPYEQHMRILIILPNLPEKALLKRAKSFPGATGLATDRIFI